MKDPRQQSLLGDPPPAAASRDASDLVTIAGAPAKLSAAQKAFNKLIAQIRSKREALVQWEVYGEHFKKRINTEYRQLADKVRAAQRQLVRQLDQVLSKPLKGERWSKSRRSRVADILLSLIEELLIAGPDDELTDIFDRHSEMSRDEQQRFELEMTEAALGNLFGADVVQGHAAADTESLFRHAQQRVTEKAQAEAQQRESVAEERRQKRGGKTTRAEAAAERRADTEKQAKQSVREIFRKLASSLHPDRETDPAERERKTELMKRINQAYQDDDLLTLLTLQIEAEQIDATSLAGLPESRLKQYNQVLREQLQTLDGELRELVSRYVDALDGDPFHPVRRTLDIDWLLQQRLAEARRLLTQLSRETAGLADPLRRKTQIDAMLASSRRGAADEDDFLAALEADFAAQDFGQPGRRGRSRR